VEVQLSQYKKYENCNGKNNASAKFYGGKVHSRMIAGDLILNGIGTLGDFGEIKDWL
jgi:hypothetical protein